MSRIVLVAALVALALVSFSVAQATFEAEPVAEPSATLASPTVTASAGSIEGSSSLVAEGGGGGTINNEVVVQNVTDGRFAHRAGVGTARVTGGDVLNTNSAAAVSSCEDCRTVAVAAQVVLVMGDSDVIAPRNQAVALNVGCLRCQSYALAYQYVVSTDGIVRFSPEGMQRLAELQAQIRTLAGSELPVLELEGQIDALVEQMWTVVDEEMVKVGARPDGTTSKDSDLAEEGEVSPSPSASSSESPLVGPTMEPSPEPSPSDEPSSEPSPAPSPTTGPSSEPSGSPEPSASPSPSSSP